MKTYHITIRIGAGAEMDVWRFTVTAHDETEAYALAVDRLLARVSITID